MVTPVGGIEPVITCYCTKDFLLFIFVVDKIVKINTPITSPTINGAKCPDVFLKAYIKLIDGCAKKSAGELILFELTEEKNMLIASGIKKMNAFFDIKYFR